MINSLTDMEYGLKHEKTRYYDPGVSFRSAIYPELGITLVIPSNKGAGPEKLMTEIERAF